MGGRWGGGGGEEGRRRGGRGEEGRRGEEDGGIEGNGKEETRRETFSINHKAVLPDKSFTLLQHRK